MRKYFIRTSKKSGSTTLYFQLRSEKHSFKMSAVNSRISVDIQKWSKASGGVKDWQKYAATDEGKKVVEKINKLEDAISLLFESDGVTPEDVNTMIKEITTDEAKTAKKERDAHKKAEAEAAKGEILNYFQYFYEGIKSGAILMKNGKRYGDSTIVVYNTFGGFLMEWLNDTPHLTFDELREENAAQFRALMNEKGLMANTKNKLTNCMRHLCNYAASQGIIKTIAPTKIWSGTEVEDTEKRMEVYVTDSELDALYLCKVEDAELQAAKDLFVFGTLIGQRFSDFNDIEPENFIEDDGDIYLNLTQKKTGNEVVIAIDDDRAVEIAKRYNYSLPTIGHQRMNVLIKRLFHSISEAVPSLSEWIITTLSSREIEAEAHYQELCNKKRNGETLSENDRKTLNKLSAAARELGGQFGQIYKRDKKNRVIKPKWSLISTHTARRSFVTNAIQEGTLERHEIMSVTGHKNERVFSQYDKTEKLMRAKQIAAKKAAAKSKPDAKKVRMRKAN